MTDPTALTLSEAYGPAIDATYWQQLRNQLPTDRVPVVAIHGGYGKRNLGDDAILHVLLAQLRQGLPETRLVVLCHGPERVRQAQGVQAVHFGSLGALRAILSADLYIIGGGGIINRINTYSGQRRLRVLDPKGKFLFLAAWLAAARGATVLFHIIGATSVPDPIVGWLARQAMNRADSVSVRDPLSAQVLRQLGVRGEIPVLPDPALSLESASPDQCQAILKQEGLDPQGQLIALNARPVAEPDIDNRRTADELALVVDWVVDTYDATVCFLPFGLHPTHVVENDLTMARRIADQVERPDRFHVLQHPCSPPEMKGVLAMMDYAILERLHACILAASVGTPLAAIAYDAKVSQFLTAIGQTPQMLSLRDMTAGALISRIQRNIPWRV